MGANEGGGRWARGLEWWTVAAPRPALQTPIPQSTPTPTSATIVWDEDRGRPWPWADRCRGAHRAARGLGALPVHGGWNGRRWVWGLHRVLFFTPYHERETEHQHARKVDRPKALAERLRKIAGNCGKLREIAKNCEIARNCEKLRKIAKVREIATNCGPQSPPPE